MPYLSSEFWHLVCLLFKVFNLFNFPIFTPIKRPSKWYKQTKMNSSNLLLDHRDFKAARCRPEFRTNKTVFDVNLYLALGGGFLLLPLPHLCSPLAQSSPLIGQCSGMPASYWSSLTSAASRGPEVKLWRWAPPRLSPGSRKQARRRFVKRKIRNDDIKTRAESFNLAFNRNLQKIWAHLLNVSKDVSGDRYIWNQDLRNQHHSRQKCQRAQWKYFNSESGISYGSHCESPG